MIISKVRKLLAAVLCVVLVSGVVWGQSTELMEAFNKYDTLYQQGRYPGFPVQRQVSPLAYLRKTSVQSLLPQRFYPW